MGDKVRTVLVTDADRGSAVAIIRSLGRKGFRVVAADSNPRSIGFRSRYASERLVYPQPEAAAERFLECLHRAVVEKGVDLIIPVTDEVIHPLTRARARFESVCRLALADTAAIERVSDKSQTLALAESLGIPIPRTRLVRTVEEAQEAAESLGWPVVLKPAVSRLYSPDRGVIEKGPVTYADGPDSLAERMLPLCGRHRVLLQEYCPGAGQGVELLSFEGRPIAAFQHRRLAEVPLTGGRSAWREGVPLDPQLYSHARRLVEALSWTGLMMVEFKVGGVVRLMEINGRVWGSLPLAIQSGMDFPARLAELYFSGPPPPGGEPLCDYRVGVRSFNLELVLGWIPRVLLGRRPCPFLPVPRRREALRACLGLLSPKQKLDLWCSDDPWPGVAEVFKIARKFGRKAKGRLSGGSRARAERAGGGPPGGKEGFRPERSGTRRGLALRSRWAQLTNRSLDAAMTASLQPRRGVLQHLKAMLSRRSTYYNRVGSLIGFVDTLFPGSGKRTTRFLLRPAFIPFQCRRVELMSFGTGSTVFLLEAGDRRLVLKAYRRTIGKRRGALLELAAAYRSRFETVHSWYSGPYRLVAPASFLVLQSPLLGRPAVACLQPYLEGEKRGLEEYSDQELVQLLQENEELRLQFAFFARRTLEVRARHGLSVDFLGPQNLMLTGTRGSRNLTLIDYGIHDLRSLQARAPDTYSRIDRSLQRLQSILEAVCPKGEASRSPARAPGRGPLLERQDVANWNGMGDNKAPLS